MPIFELSQTKLTPIKELKFDLEKDMQSTTEQNLETVFGLQFVTTEFQLNNLRIDTLAFNPDTKAFVIIEYKRDHSFSVIDQGYAYLGLMLNNKADFILEYNEKAKKSLGKNDVDWTQSRVIFIANSFTTYQQQAINFKDLPIELWELKKYTNNTLLYNQLKTPEASESIKTVSKNKTIEKVSQEVRKYSIDDHINGVPESIKEVYEVLRAGILSLDPRIEEAPQKSYIGYRISWRNLTALFIKKEKIKIDITRTHPSELKDPEKRVTLRNNSLQYFGQYISRVEVTNVGEAEYALSLIRQAYERQYK